MTECCTVQVSPSHNDQTTRTEQQNHHQVHVRSPFSGKSKKLPNFFIETILSSDSELPRFSEKLDFENTRVASQAKIFNTDVSAINYSDKNPIRWREACWSAYQEPHPRSYFCQEIARLTLQFQANNSVYRPIPIDQIYAVVTSRNHPESDRPPDFGPSERPAGLSNCNASRSNEVSAAEIVRGQLSSKNSASDTSLSQKKLFDKERVLSSNARVENDSEARKESSTKNKTDPSTTPTDETTKPKVWPAWVYCTRYSDRPSAGELLNNLFRDVTNRLFCYEKHRLIVLPVDASASTTFSAFLPMHKGAAKGGAEGAQDPLFAIRILMFIFLVIHQHCKSRSGVLQNVLRQYHKA